MLDWVALSHVFGRLPAVLTALVLFCVGAILCAVAKNFTLMLVGRCIQGSGAGGIISLTQVLITDMVPLRDRGKYFALVSTVWAIGSVAGPIIGGVFAQESSWTGIFWLNVPIVVIGFIGSVAFLTLNYRKRSFLTKLSEIDFIGSFIFIASTTSFLIPISWGGVMYAWTSWRTLVPLIVGGFGILSFAAYEAKLATVKILPVRVFSSISTVIVYVGTFLHGIVLWSMVYYLPLYFQAVKGYSPIIAGVAALPQTCTIVPCAIAVGILASITGKYRWALWGGWILTTLGCGILYLLDVSTGMAAWIFLELVSGIGIGLLFPSMSLAIQASAPPQDMAVAATLFSFFRAFGEGVGVAIGGVIFQNRMRIELLSFPDLADSASQYAGDAVALVEIIKQLPAGDLRTLHLKMAFANSIKVIWAVMCGLAGISMLVHAFVKEFDLNQEHITDQGFANGKTDDVQLVTREEITGGTSVEAIIETREP